MIGSCLARTALLGLASPARAHKPIYSVILCVLWLDRNVIGILLGCVLGIALYEVKLGLALAAADEVVHLPDGFGVELVVLLLADDALDLLALDVDFAGRVEALEAASLVDELRVDELVDAAQAEGVPAAEERHQHVPVVALVELAVAALANHDLRAVVDPLFVFPGVLLDRLRRRLQDLLLDHLHYIAVVLPRLDLALRCDLA